MNNAQVADKKTYSIAVPVPLSTDMTTAQEILRGVAQAQKEVNLVTSFPLTVVIADDNNNPNTAKQLAQSLTDNKDILGVVGHFSSGVTLAAAPIYQAKGLVAISPTSTSVTISNMGDYIFRTVPSDRFAGNAIAQYTLERLNKTKAAVIYNSQSAYSKSLKDSFATDIANSGGEVGLEIDLSQGNFNPAEVLQQAQAEAEVLVFLNDSGTIDKAYLLMQLNNNKMPMVAGDSFYKPQTLQNVGEKAVGLVLAVPWHILGNADVNFVSASRKLWGGDVNWRTAMAYDAVKAIDSSVGIVDYPSRQSIQKKLSKPGFSFNGASGKVKFLLSGDRNSPVQLVTVEPGKRSSYGYDFVPLK